MAMKVCVECKNEISSSVKKCPHCGKDQRNFFMRHKIITFIGALIMLGIIGSLSKPTTVTVSPETKAVESKSDADTPQPSPTSKPADMKPTPTPKPAKYEILEHSMETGNYISKIVGKIQNNSGKKSGYVQVSINLYDGDGVQVGSTFANVNNLEPGSVWQFEAMVTSDKAKTYKIMEVTGF